MEIPRFFHAGLFDNGVIQLDETASKHCVQVLRMKTGDAIELVNGQGYAAQAIIAEAGKKKCTVQVTAQELRAATRPQHTIGLSLLKNTARFEWFLEKATELGIGAIIPLLCTRTERQHFRHERMNNIVIAAMLQSQRYYLPTLHEPMPFANCIATNTSAQKMIAHCMEGDKQPLQNQLHEKAASRLILIGPEGDFTGDEVEAALAAGFKAVSLGGSRLRTETAGVAAAVLLGMA
jgi:16S rRNA (uracil1498-N3)-methyltransferase